MEPRATTEEAQAAIEETLRVYNILCGAGRPKPPLLIARVPDFEAAFGDVVGLLQIPPEALGR